MRIRCCRCLAIVGSLIMIGASAFGFDAFITMQDGYFYDSGSGEAWVPHGIAYQTWNRPLGVWQTEKQVDYDLDEMVKMGANSVRIDIVWQHAEEDGDNQFKWDNYDYFINACEERGIRIFALIGYQWPPNWFPDAWYTMHPPAVDAEGIEHTNRWQSDIINYEHPDARAQYAEWIETVAGRYKDEKAIVGWIVGNESGYLGLWSGLLDGYDPETEQAFRVWTSNEYSTITAANAAWGTDYDTFEDIVFVEEYRAYGPEGAQWADMVQFREDSIASFTAVGAVAAKQGDTNHLISYSTVGMQWGEEDWRYHAEDRGKITAACAASNAPIDFFCVNNYPWSLLGHESQNGQWGVSYTKKVAGVPVVYSETGFTSSETMWPGMTEIRQGELIRNSLWESLEAGAIGTHIFSWMDRPYITDREKGFGIVYADRRIKPAFWESRDVFTLMDQVEIHNLLMGSEDPTPDIAFLWTDAVDSQFNRYECEMQQIAGALERIGYEPNFLDLQDLADGAYTNYKVVILPRNMRVEETVPGYTNSILNFLETQVIPAGVHIMACADLPGMQNPNGQERDAFESEVDSLFGIDASNIGGEEAPQRVTVFVSWNWKPLDVTFTTNAVGAVSGGYAYTCQTWKYSDEIEVTDGDLWATMDTRRNKGFEDSNTNAASWDGTWGEVHVRNGWGWAYEGDNMVQMWDESGLWKDFPALPFGRYTHSAFLRSNNDDPLRGGAYAMTALEWYDEDDSLLGVSQSTPLTGNTPDNGWVEYVVDAEAPAGTITARRMTRINEAPLNLLANGDLSGTGSGPDDWSEWNSSNHDPDTDTYRSESNSWVFWYDGGIYQNITSGFGEGDMLRVGGYLRTEAGGGSGGTLDNASFEDDATGTSPPSNWTKQGNGGVWSEQHSNFADDGTNCAKIYQGYANQTTAIYQDLGAAESDEFIATAKVYDWSLSGNPMASGDKAYVILEWKDSGGSDLGSAVTSAYVTSSSGQDTWHTVSVTGSAPASAASARIVLALTAGGGNNVVAYYDTTSLELQSTADPLRDGTKHGVVEVEFYDADDSKISSASASPTINLDSVGDTWILSETEATVPSGAVSARIVVRCNDYTNGEGRFYADDIFVVNETHFPNMLANPELDGSGTGPTDWSQWNDGSHDPDTDNYRSASQSWMFWWDGGIYQEVTNGFSGNDTLQFGGYLFTEAGSGGGDELSNASFEDDATGTSPPSNWTKVGNGGTWTEQHSNFADDGTNVAKIYQGWGNQATELYQAMSAVESDEFVATAKIYDWNLSGNPMASGDKAYVVLEWRDSSSSLLAGSVTSAVITSSSGQDTWHTVSVTGTAPASVSTARIVLRLVAGGNNVVVYWDTTSLTVSDTSDPLRDGTKYGIVQLELYDGATKLSTTSASPTISTNSEQGTWIRAEGSVTVPTNATKARVVVRCNDHSSGDGRFMADDIFLKNQTPGGSVYVDGKSEAPAVVVKDHGAGKGKAAIFLYAAGDNNPDGDEDGDMDILPWEYRYDIFSSVVRDYFGIEPAIQVTSTNAYLCLPEYRTCSNGMVLLQIKNYMYEPGTTNGGAGLTFTINSGLFSNKTIEALGAAEVIEENSDGTIELTLEPDGMEMLLVYETGLVNQIVRIVDAPAVLHPFGSDSYQAKVRYDCLDRSDLTLCIAFMEDGDNGDGVTNEIYQLVEAAVTGNGEHAFHVWIPDPDQEDSDYISTPDGGAYQFYAWLRDASSNVVAEAIPQMTQLKWGVRATNDMPASVEKGDSVNMNIEWEELYEYLPWENTPIARNDAFADRVAIFRSSKTESEYGGHFDAVNEVCDWLESMGYSSGNDLDISFDNVTVSNLFTDNFNDGDMAGWTRDAGCGNWEVIGNELDAWRIGNDDNIVSAGSAWTNYTASVDITYNVQGPYFSDAELYVRYQDRNNFVKVGIRNFHGFWRLKYTVRVATNNLYQGWLHDFPKTNAPTTNVTYNLRVDAQGDTFTVFFDGTEVGSFSDTNFATGKIALGTKAVQLGIWDPAKGYYFIDDDEYSYYSADEQETVTTGSPLDLDWGYLNTFFPTLILPGTYVMSDIEVSNVVTWANIGMRNLIATDGGIARKDKNGIDDLGRIEALFGVAASINGVTNLSQATIGSEDHYVTLDYDAGDTLTISGNANAWNSLNGGTSLGTVDNGVDSVPAFICNTITTDPDAPGKVFCFNFGVDSGGQLTNGIATIAQRAFEWVRGEAFKVTLELKFDTQSTNAYDFTIYTTTGWILTGDGSSTLVVDIPTNNIMTGDNMYWVLYVHRWDSDDPYGDHVGFYSSENDGSAGVYTSIGGIGLQILGITDVAYAGRDWDKWIAFNTRTQDLVLAYGIKDKGQIEKQDNFDDGNYSGWTVDANANISWSVTNQALRATVSGAGGDSSITMDGLDLNNTNITIEYDVLFENGAVSGGIIYRGIECEINPTHYGWIDADTNYYTDNLISTGEWHHVVVNIRDGNPYLRCDVRVGTNIIFASEDIETTNFTTNTVGFIAPEANGYTAWDNFRLVDEEYAVVWSTVNGISYPTNDVPTGTWPSVPDYDPDMIEHGGYNEGSEYEWFIQFAGKEGVFARQDVDIFFAPRLMVESTNFPVQMDRGETVSVPIEWEGIGNGTAAKLWLSLEDPYLGTNVCRDTFDITNETGTADFTMTIDEDATSSKNYSWLAYFYPTTATNPMLQRIGLDDTYRFQPVIDGAPIGPETEIEVTAIVDGDFVVYEDAGIPANAEIFTWYGLSATFDANYLWGPTPIPEGDECFYTFTTLWGGWGIFNTNEVDLSEYTNGYLKFSLYSQETLKVEIEGPKGTKNSVNVGTTDAAWEEIAIAITNFPSVNKSRVYGMFSITSFDGALYLVDQVRWSDTAD